MTERRTFLKNLIFGIGAVVLPVEIPKVTYVTPLILPTLEEQGYILSPNFTCR